MVFRRGKENKGFKSFNNILSLEKFMFQFMWKEGSESVFNVVKSVEGY